MDQDTQISTPVQRPEAASEAVPVSAAGSAAATTAAAPARKGRSAGLLNLLLGGALVLAVAGLGFAAGRMTAPSPASIITGSGLPGGQVFGGNGGIRPGGDGGPINGQGGFIAGGPTIEGTVESITDTTLTLKLADGQTIQIALDDSTTYHAQTDASSDAVAPGGKVQVRIDARTQGGTGAGTGGMSAGDVTVVP